ncbi:MAG: hypothetical protein KAY24_06430, partial [Candidatus Eisenbacteria sp.]|nr:hypothetical protein [Candidatus Eisenbacteria bacterium]
MRGRTHLGFTVITLLILCAALQVAPARSMTIIPALPDGELLKVTISCDAPYRAPDSTQEALPHRTLDSAQESLPLLARLVALPVGTTSVKLVGGTATGTAGVYDLSPDQVLLSSVMIMRGQPVVVVSLNAGTFSDDLRAGLEHIEIALAPTHDASTDPFVHDGSGTDMAHPMCFTEGAGGLETNRGVYMIIAADEFVEALSDFVTWKTQAGFDVRLFAVSEIESPTTREGLLAFVQDAYDTWETPPLYLLLVGDVGDVPAWDIGANVSDHPYACLDGDDFIADLYVGRFSASSAAEVDVQVAKTVGYESHPDTTAGGGEWFSRALLVAGDLGSSTPKPTSRWIGQELLNIGYTQIDSCFGPPFWDEGKIIIPLMVNSGVGIVNYRGWAIG